MITVSVIIPNYNHAAYLKQRIESVLSQSFTDFEIILLDDCSTDNSREVIEQYRNHKQVSHLVYNEANSGSTFYQWEKGLTLAKGKYIWIAESDDFCAPDFLELLVNALDRDNELALAYAKTMRVDEEGALISDLAFWYNDLSKTRWTKSYKATGNNEIRKYLSIKNTIPNASAVLFRRSALNVFDKVILNFKVCGDWYFWMQLIKNHKLAYVAGTTNYFRTHTASVRASKGDATLIEKETIMIRDYITAQRIMTEQEIALHLAKHQNDSFITTGKRKIRSLLGTIKRSIVK